MKKIAVLLFNLGGPQKQEDVQGFLYNLFADRRIIGLPWGLRQGVAALISSRRAPMAKQNYQLMGGGSPILAETQAQAQALEAYLNSKGDIAAKVFIGMRYWHPFIEDTAREIAAWEPDEVVLLPLYPQFSSTTTLSGDEVFRKVWRGKAPIHSVCCYSGNDDFIAAHVRTISDELSRLEQPGNVRLLFSAHGLPEKIIRAGDPYQEQVEACVAKIMAQLGPVDHTICYQSRVGPLKWIGPSTEAALAAAAKDGKDVMVIPIAFVSEHIETLVELDIEYAELAHKLGISVYRRVPALRADAGFIQALGVEVHKAIASTEPVIGDHNCAACHKFCPRKAA